MLLHCIFSLLGVMCVSVSTRHTNSSGTGGEAAMLEEVLDTLQELNRRLQSVDSRLDSIGRHVCPPIRDSHTKCRTSADGRRTCYKLITQRRSWAEGREHCRRLCNVADADLVAIESSEEQVFLDNMLRDLQHNCEQVYTSGRLQSSGAWVWEGTGQTVDYTAWYPGSPSGEGEDTITLTENFGFQWNDAPANILWCSICEYH